MTMAIYTAKLPFDDPVHWEDECMVQFGVEDDDVEHRLQGSGVTAGGVIFREYGGEDFSKYLDDDEVPAASPAFTGSPQVLEETKKPSSTHRYQKRQSRKRPDEAATAIGAFDQVESPADSGPKRSLDGLRERLVQLLPGSGKTHRSKSREVNRIHNCSFTDLRIGSSLLIEQQRLSAGSSIAGSSAANATAVQHESDSGIEIRSSISLETRSDLGFREQSSSWWNLDTLSDRDPQGTSVIESNGGRKTRNMGASKFQRRAESVPDLLDSREDEEGAHRRISHDSGSSGVRVNQTRRLESVDGGLVNCWDEDVRRQAAQSTTPKTVAGKSIWKRLSHTINKRTRRSKEFDGRQKLQRPPANDVRPTPIIQQRPPANDIRPTPINQQRPPANAMRPPPTPPPNSFSSAGIYDEIRL